MKVAERYHKHNISEPTFYAWRTNFGGVRVSDGKRLKQFQAKDARPKKLLAEAMLDNAVLKDDTSRQW